jgi:hypothetical protein
LALNSNNLTGTIPKGFLALTNIAVMNVSRNLLTGNATRFVDTFGWVPFQNNCFDPAVPPSNPSCWRVLITGTAATEPLGVDVPSVVVNHRTLQA